MNNLPIFVLSLERAAKRRAFIKESFERYHLSYQILDGIDGKKLTSSQIDYYNTKENLKRYKRKLSDGEIGCLLSHQLAYQALLNSTENWAIIIEDDAEINDEFAKFVQTDISSLNENNFYLLSFGFPHYQQYVKTSLFSAIKIGNFELKKTIRSTKHCASGGCYLISKKVASKLIGVHQKIPFMADDWTIPQKHKAFDHFYFYPLLNFINLPEESFINKERSILMKQLEEKNISTSVKIKNILKLREIKRFIRSKFRNIYRLVP